MLALAHPLSSLLCPCSGPGPAASSGLFLRPLPTSPLPVIPVKPSRLLQDTHTHTRNQCRNSNAGAVSTPSPFADILTGFYSIRPKPCL
ncbi:hypothetical protein CTAM01_12126 [Colletotrichum tamarilloi]|uniref:Secreted protein n=1 Tax=Colletotrichum tamarilloi TaxID=1209934 RepID=A0ABQ9QVQ5_9PEZI|nr:uncharacterized protein CTAM01_12126 [Colletotrichum tamarilloi]KAK1486693.1 hypothetical protein CTAM01_12126 [Colletotrichum tamarilloi]